MSTFNRLCAKAKRAVKKVSDKANELADSASRSVKIKALEIRIDEQYELLGEIVYRDLHTGESLEEEKLQIIATIDGLFDQMEELKKVTAEEDAVQNDEPTSDTACDEDAAAEEVCDEQVVDETASTADAEPEKEEE